MAGPVYHAAACPWRGGGQCECGGNRRWRPSPLVICMVCTDDPCSCERFANAEEARA